MGKLFSRFLKDPYGYLKPALWDYSPRGLVLFYKFPAGRINSKWCRLFSGTIKIFMLAAGMTGLSCLTFSPQQELAALRMDRVELRRRRCRSHSMDLRGYCLLGCRCRQLNGMHEVGLHFAKSSRKRRLFVSAPRNSVLVKPGLPVRKSFHVEGVYF